MGTPRTGDRYAVQCNGITVATFADQGEATAWKDEQEKAHALPGWTRTPQVWAVVDTETGERSTIP